ncbi:MAG: MT-A70 family methyltransferase, partial [Phycisphaerae bacterium]|nr:MT-A70 family methyltransferase [Phycisphaerae bacterium]
LAMAMRPMMRRRGGGRKYFIYNTLRRSIPSSVQQTACRTGLGQTPFPDPNRDQTLGSDLSSNPSRKPDEIYDLVEACSPGPYLELFARFQRPGWEQWGNEDVEENSAIGVARRKGHVDPQLRFLESPRGYGT